MINNITVKDERHRHITFMVSKFWSKDTSTENSKEFKKEKYYVGILMNFKKLLIDLKIPVYTA